MEITIAEGSQELQRLVATWRYPGPYDFYDGDPEPVLNPERFFEARDQRGNAIGFYYFEEKPPNLAYGLGLRPDLTGQGLGLQFFLAGLAFAHERYRPERVHLHVAAFNERARRVYERAGFRIVSSHVRTFERFGKVPFLTMVEERAPIGAISVKRLEPDEVAAVSRQLPLSRLRQPLEDGSTYLIAWGADQPVGHAHIAWDGTHLALPEIQDVFVVPEQRRRGIATELTRAAETEARNRGWRTISLSVSQDGNAQARRLYEKLGYVEAGVEPVRVFGEIMLRGGPLRIDDTLVYLTKPL
jgi:[ribosomal protein S18]-alanine N-acetyltransferase